MKIDFHTHTYYSYDSIMKPKKIIEIAKSRGLTGIVICDHNTIKGGIEAKDYNTDENFHVIVGAEIRTNVGDITGLFLTKEILSREFSAVVNEIKLQGGRVLLNHPYESHDLDKIDFTKIDYIEGYNARESKHNNEKAISLAKKHNIPILAGSDAHLYVEIANAYTIVDNINDLNPIAHSQKSSKLVYQTISQCIKAIKLKRPKIIIDATFALIKKTVLKI